MQANMSVLQEKNTQEIHTKEVLNEARKSEW